MRRILDIIQVGSKVAIDGRIHTIVADLGNGVFEWQDNQNPPAIGTFEFDNDTYENINLTVID